MSTEPESPFEKTFRLVTRLDDAEIDYVRDTSEWITRVVLRVRQLDPQADIDALTAEVLGMSTRGRWRLMKPEIVGDQLVLPIAAPATVPGA